MVDNIEIYLLLGQSNADGRAYVTDLPAEYVNVPTNIEYWYRGNRYNRTDNVVTFGGFYRFGPAPTLLSKLGICRHDKRIIVVQHSYGGSSLYSSWHSPLYDSNRAAVMGETVSIYQWYSFLNGFFAALGNREAVYKTVFWLQGEQDATNATAAQDYYNGLVNLVYNIDKFVGTFEQIVICNITSPDTDVGYSDVRSAIANFSYPDSLWPVTVLSLDGYTHMDAYHYDSSAYIQIGALLASCV